MERKRSHFFILFCAVAAVFGNSLFNGFVWDNKGLLLEIEAYNKFDLYKIFFSLANGVEYLPLRDLSYAIDFAVWGKNPTGFILTNLILYYSNVLAVYYFTLTLSRFVIKKGDGPSDHIVSLSTAFLFAIHPIHCESVDFITCRGYLISALFIYISCISYIYFLEYGHRKYYVTSISGFIFALLTKTTAIIFPFIVFLLTIFYLKRKEIKTFIYIVPFLFLSLIFYFIFKEAGYKSGAISEYSAAFGSGNILTKIAVASQIPFFYLYKLLIPVGFSAEYDVEFARTISDTAAVMPVTALSIALIAVIISKKKSPYLSFSLLWFIITLIPVLNFFSTTPVVADRYAYLPSFAFFYFFASVSCGALKNFYLSQRGKDLTGKALNSNALTLRLSVKNVLVLFLGVLIVLSWSISAINRNRAWKDDITLWSANIKTSPSNIKSYVNLGYAYLDKKDYDRALYYYKKVQDIAPSSGYYDYGRGRMYFEKGDYSKAADAFEAAISANRDFFHALYSLGLSYERLGELEKALAAYNRASQSKVAEPNYKKAAKENAERLRGVFGRELDELRKKVVQYPGNNDLELELAMALDEMGIYNEAIRVFHDLEEKGVKTWQLFYNIANTYAKNGNYEKAAHYYNKTLEVKPDHINGLYNLGLAYLYSHKYEMAISSFRKVIKMDGDYAYAPFNLAVTYYMVGDKENALKYFEYTANRFPDLRNNVKGYLNLLNE